MSLSKYILILCLFMFTALSSFRAPISYKIKADEAKILFAIKNAGFTVDGGFLGLSGTIRFDSNQLSDSKINLSLIANSIYTGIKKRDKSLWGKDYFEVDKYPVIRFSSTSLSPTKTAYKVIGNLSLKATSRQVEIPFIFSNNIFKGSFSIDRRDYGVGGNSWIMGDSVKISFKIPVEPV